VTWKIFVVILQKKDSHTRKSRDSSLAQRNTKRNMYENPFKIAFPKIQRANEMMSRISIPSFVSTGAIASTFKMELSKVFNRRDDS